MIKRLLFLFFIFPSIVFGQLTENFESGDLSLWTQSAEGHWAISAINPISGLNSLQQVYNSTTDSRDQISAALPLMDFSSQKVVWRFRLKHGYDPSSSNNWGVFLASSSNASGMYPGGTANGYVLGVNYTGGTDDILRLWKVTNGNGTSIITTSLNWQTMVTISRSPAIEVIKNADGVWQIKVDVDGSFSNLLLVGEAPDNSYSYSDYFGIYYKYSSTQDLKLWFDDFSVETFDTIPPRIYQLSAKTSTNIEVVFGEKMDSVSVRNKLNYFIDGGMGNPDSILFNRNDLKKLSLIYNDKLINQQEYQIQVRNCEDLKGNILTDTTIAFTFEYIKPLGVDIASSNQLRITFSKITDTFSAQNPLNYSLDNGVGNPQSATVLAGDSTKVILLFSSGFTNKTRYKLFVQDVADRGLDSMLNAELSFLYFIPQPYDIVINEIMADPSPEVNLPNFEYVEILNATPFAIDITGWKIKIGATEKVIPSYILDSAAYLVLASTTAVADLSPYGEVLGIASFPTITNSGSTISFSKPDNTIISNVSFTTDWYNDKTKIDGGWSLERIDPLNICSGITNWRASISPNGGTPGTINSVYAPNIDTSYPQAQKIEVVSANQLRVVFNEPLNTTTATIISNYLINNFIGTPDSAKVSNNSTQIDLYFTNSFVNKTYYSLSVSSISDNCGNVSPVFELTFLYYLVQPYDVVINEIMADPTPEINLPAFEYIELYNTTEYPIDLTSWKLKVGSSEVVFPSYTLNQDEYVILCTTGASSQLEGFGDILAFASIPAITNAGATVSVSDKTGQRISSVTFTTDWYNDKTKIDGGWSLEQIDPLNICSGITNWKASVSPNGGTPGIINSVYAPNMDTAAPYVETVEIISSTQIRIGFNEPVDSSTALIKTNYLVNEGVGNPFTVLISTNFKQIDLIFINAFPQSTNLILSVSNISDECGNSLVLQELDFSYYVAQPYDIVINEIMADPDPVVYLPAYEYIELYNKTDYNIGLAGWTITTGSTKRTLPSFTIEPHSYLILCSESAYPFLKEFGNAVAVSGFAAITNSGQTIVLKSREERIVSVVSFTDKWYKNSLKADGGWSLEQIDPDNPCGGENNWTASTNSNGGTPGQQNSVMASNPDLIAPELLRVTVINNTSIRLFFNESIDSISAMELSNYNVDQEVGTPIGLAMISPDYLSLTLTFSDLFVTNTIYTIEVLGGLTDCSGNEIGTYNSARFAIPVNPEPKDLVINEILFNPRSGGYDFVELYNRSQKTIDLKNLRIAAYDDLKGEYTTIKNIADNGFLVFPGDYVALTENPQVVQQHYYSSNQPGFVKMSSLPSYNDDSGRAILIDQNQNIIDNMAYDKSMHFALLATVDGVSLERINPDRSTDDKSNWHSASELVGFATPAYKNSQYKELSESDDRIKVYPEVFSPDNDGFEDVVDIQLTFDNPGYVANIKIYDSRGRLVKYLANNLLLGTENTISWDGLTDQNQKTPKGIYVIYFEIFDLKGNVKKYRKPLVVAERF